MCIVIDMNAFSCVFNETNENHENYSPVKEWILNGKGKIVVGGSSYLKELGKLGKYRKFFIELRKAVKVIVVEDEKSIDELEAELKVKFSHKDFDDPHIVALLIVSGCRVVCSDDSRAYSFIKAKKLYPKGSTIPKIYGKNSYSSKDKILSDKNIAEICKPCNRLKKDRVEELRMFTFNT
jgi:hypothetical protein